MKRKLEPNNSVFDINASHEQIEALLGKNVLLKFITGRKEKIDEGKIISVNSNVFVVEIFSGKTKIKKSYNYTDLFIGRLSVEEFLG